MWRNHVETERQTLFEELGNTMGTWKTTWVGEKIYCYETIDSTNLQAKRLAEKGEENGTLVIAEGQEAGRGRRGRTWESPLGTTISMSLLLKPEIEPNSAPMITLVAALAVSKAIIKLTKQQAAIKWPNDIVMNGKKVCGILTEMSLQSGKIENIVVGIGINVSIEHFPKELEDTATSIYLETGIFFSRLELIKTVCEFFQMDYNLYLMTEDLRNLVQEYNELLINKDRKVKVLDPKGEFEGYARGITPYGELIVDTEEGQKLISSGEVSVRGIYGYV